MDENAPASPKMLAEIVGGFLTWLGTAVIVMTVAWLVVMALYWTDSNWRVAIVACIGGPVAWLIARYIEQKRNA
jgi:hypothetical protein